MVKALNDYTKDSGRLNRNLIAGRPLQGRQKAIHETILDMARPCRSDMVLFSGTGDVDFSKIAMKCGGKIKSPAHLSTTRKEAAASPFAFAPGGRSQMIRVVAKAGTPVVSMSAMSDFPEESEILLPSGVELVYVSTSVGELHGLYEGKKVTIHDFVAV